MNILKALWLNKEARLFDTKEFLLKTFVAVLIASFVGRGIPYVSKDMISLLFGMILTLDPVNLTGLRNGFKQVEATILGALITGVILWAVGFGAMADGVFGYSPWAVALAVTATLYVSLLIDWRNFSVVAVFTSIYMTQYVQFGPTGQPSEIETFKLRIAALLSGVVIAFVVNFLFSVFGYRHMLEKRVYHLMDDLYKKMNGIKAMIEEGDLLKAGDLMGQFPTLFNNIDWINGTISDFKKDPLVKRGKVKQIRLEKIQKMTTLIREMTHINYDICYKISHGVHVYKEPEFMTSYNRVLMNIEVLLENMEAIISNKEGHASLPESEPIMELYELKQLCDNTQHIYMLLKHYQ